MGCSYGLILLHFSQLFFSKNLLVVSFILKLSFLTVKTHTRYQSDSMSIIYVSLNLLHIDVLHLFRHFAKLTEPFVFNFDRLEATVVAYVWADVAVRSHTNESILYVASIHTKGSVLLLRRFAIV